MSNEQGFTLIEMLIALAIFATLITVLLSGYTQGLSLWQRSGKVSTEWKQLESRSAWMRRLSGNIVAAEYRTIGGYSPFFVGDMRGFKAMSSSPIMSPSGRVIPVEFRLVHDASSGVERLLYREGVQGEDPDRGMFAQKTEWVELFDALENARFSYFMAAVTLKGASESAGWKNKASTVPMQIAFSFDKDGRSHQWRFRSQSYSNAMALGGVYEGG